MAGQGKNIDNTPQAKDDVAAASENVRLSIDVLANDLGGNGKSLYSVDQSRPAQAATTGVTAAGAQLSIVDGRIVYLADSSRANALAAGQTLTDTFTYTIQMGKNGALSTATVTVTLTGTNDRPVAMADLAATGENEAVTIDVLANDTDLDAGAVKTLVSVDMPKGSAAVVDGKVLFTPGEAFDHLAQGQSEEVTLTYIMKDEHGATSTASVVVTVTGANDAPVARADAASTGENQAVTIDVLVNDTDPDAGAVKTLVSVDTPKGSAAVVDGKVLFTPGEAFDHLAQGQSEEVTLTYIMKDDHGATSTASVLVTVTGANDAPVARADAASTGENQAVTIDVLANDTDADAGAVKTLVSVDTPKGSAAVVDGKVLFTPGEAFDHLAQGQSEEVTLAYTMKDEHGATSTASVLVTVTGANDAPVARADAASTGENQAVTIDVLANDTDADAGAVKTLVSVAAPKGSAVVTDGKVVFTPGSAFDSLAEGHREDVTLTYVMRDEHGATSTASIVVTVTGANDAPVARADMANTGENQAIVIDVLANDTDLDAGAVKTLVSVEAPKGSGAVVDGKVVFTPGAAFDSLAEGQSEDVTLTYVMLDEHGASATSTALVRVTGANDAPSIAAAGVTATGAVRELADGAAGENSATHTLSGAVAFADPDLADVHTATVSPGGAGYIGALTLSPVDQAANRVAWTFQVPDSALDGLVAGEVRTQTYTVQVADGRGGVASQTISVTLTGAADAPPAPIPPAAQVPSAPAPAPADAQPDVIAFLGSTYRLLSGVRDTNGDGVLDSATVSPARTILSGFSARGGDVGDVDGDGDLDAVVSNFSGRSALLLNSGDANGDSQADFAVSYLSLPADGVNQWQDARLADVNGDGRLDIVEGGRTADRLHLNRGDVNGDGVVDFTTRLLPSAASQAYSYGVDVADLNGDGRQDIVLTTYGAAAGQTTLALLLNLGDANGDGAPEFRAVTLSTVDTTLAGIDIADMNGDGRLDIAVAAYTGGSYVLQGRGDVDGDGAPDFVSSGVVASSAYMGATFADIDGDGDLDVLFGDRSGGSELAMNLGDTDGDRVTNFRVVTLARGGDAVAVSDFDRDGDADLLFSDGWVATNRGDLDWDGLVDFAYAQVVSLNNAWDVVPGDFLA
ncbi:Ig-like domain-containing protein [Phenylobacterium sp.]|uniref:Ig-like domain-containing protein n=1 Tax=Phenylobacterium sp. TaxID=1871053 RepID=UPI0035B169A2